MSWERTRVYEYTHRVRKGDDAEGVNAPSDAESTFPTTWAVGRVETVRFSLRSAFSRMMIRHDFSIVSKIF